MYGNIAKAGRKDNMTRYYYYCKNTVNATGHKCTFRCNIEQSQIDADSIYGYLNAFNELYAECTDAEKKQFMQAFIERIDIFPERREDGNWIRNIKFPVPILRDGKEVARVDGISLDNEQFDEHTVSLEKLSTLETVVLLSQRKADDYVEVELELDELDLTSADRSGAKTGDTRCTGVFWNDLER